MSKIANACIVSDLDDWAKILPNNFTLKKSLFGATNIVKNCDKSKNVYSGYGIAFGGLGSWSFGNNFARNVVIFGVNNSSSSHTGNHKNNVLMLNEWPTDDIAWIYITIMIIVYWQKRYL